MSAERRNRKDQTVNPNNLNLSELFADAFDGVAPIEASAEARESARELRKLFAALTAEGFSNGQALYVIGSMIGAASHE